MDTAKTGVMTSIQTKVKQDGSGEYYIVKFKNEAGDAQPDHLCFSAAIKVIAAGQKFSYTNNEKNGTFFLNLPKEGGAKTPYGASVPRGRSPEELAIEKMRVLVSIETMSMAYAKDLIIALISTSKKVDNIPLDSIQNQLLSTYSRISEAIANNLGGVPGKKREKEEDAGVGDALAADIKNYLLGLSNFGWIYPDTLEQTIISRLSTKKEKQADGTVKLITGPVTVDGMSAGMIKTTADHFKQFTQKECQGDPKGCKHFKAMSGEHANWCEWIARCVYVQNKGGRA